MYLVAKEDYFYKETKILTKGKSYKVENRCYDIRFRIKNDSNVLDWISSSRFTSLRNYLDEKIKNLIN